MSRFIAEKDTEFEDQALVLELTEDPDTNGRTVGWCMPPEALDNAQAVADTINSTGHQPSPAKRLGLNYTAADEF
jgi:hypothetical protein